MQPENSTYSLLELILVLKKILKRFKIRYRKGEWKWCYCEFCMQYKETVEDLKTYLRKEELSEEERKDFEELKKETCSILKIGTKRISLY